MSKLFLTLIVTLLIIKNVKAGKYALEVDKTNFDEKIKKDPRVFVMEFYSPMCGSCKEFAPKWEKLEKVLEEKLIGAAKVNIDNKEA